MLISDSKFYLCIVSFKNILFIKCYARPRSAIGRAPDS